MVIADTGIVVYGGVYWEDSNLDEVDLEQKRQNNFISECSDFMAQQGLSVNDMGSERWNRTNQRYSSVTECFDLTVNPPFDEI